MALSSKQPRWDIYETVILLEGYLETLQGIQSKSQIIKRISADLRRMAVNRGVEIDDVYRNENGISYQIQSMDSAFKGQKVYVPATKLFTDAVTLYRTDNDGYQKFLWEAKGMIAVKQNNREAFLIWAKSAFSAQRCKWLEENILKMERFAVAARMISGSIFDVTDTAKLEAVYRASCKNKFFQIRHRKFIKNINEDFKEYIKYCSLKPDIREPASDSKAPTVSPETARSNVKIGSFVVNFDAEESMAYTKPTSVSLFGKELLRPSVWKDVYVCVIAALFEKHPDIFNSMHSFPGSKRIEFAKPQDADRMLSPKLVSDSLCVETNFSATDFIKRLKTLLTMCEESYDSLKITYEKRLYNCKKGMHIFLEHFEGGKLLSVAKEIGTEDSVLADIKKLFSVQYSALWIGSTGEDEIRKLITEYEVVKYTNILLNVTAHSKDTAFKEWRETLKFIGFSCESVKAKKPALDKFFYNLLRIANYEDMLPDNMKSFLNEMNNHNADIREVLDNPLAVFMNVYAPYLEGFSDVECEEIKNSISSEMFTASATASNATVKKAADDYRKNQVKSQLYKLWSDKTGGSKNPRAWSEKHRTPILCCIKAEHYADAKKAFSTLNSSTQSEADIKDALAFLQRAEFFEDIASSDYRDKWFAKRIIGDYASLLPDIDSVRDVLESTGISAYEWNDNPTIRSKVSGLANAEYNAGGSDKVVDIIEGMDDAELKKWLTDIVRKDMGLGVKIIINKEE